MINSTKKLKLHVKKDQFEAFLSDFLLKLVGQKGKLLTDKQQKLLEKAISSTANAAKKKSKAKVTQSSKRAKTVYWQCWTFWLLMFKSRGWLLL